MSLVLGACGDSEPDPGDVCTREDHRSIPVWQRPALDVLIVLDRSPSMADETPRLAALGATLDQVVEQIGGGVPDLQIGVVTSDLGGSGVDGCDAGDGGAFQGGVRCGLDGTFLRARGLVAGGVGGNVSGDLDDALTCLLDVPLSGCPVSQPLGAAVRALDGSVAGNAGFRRAYAALVVVIVTDGDDCTLSNPSALSAVVAPSDLEGAVDFACFARGNRCTPDDAATVGAHTACTPRSDQGVADVATLVTELRGFVANPRDLVVTTVAADREPVMVAGGARLANACPGNQESAVAAPRLGAVELPERAFVTDVCGDWTDALVAVASLIRIPLGLVCAERAWDLDPATPGAQVNCVNALVNARGEPYAPLPWCDDAGVDRSEPCVEPIVEDPQQCPDGLGSLVISLGDQRLPDGLYAELRCEVACE